VLGRRYLGEIEPRVKEYTIQYLEDRFDSDVELAGLRVRFARVPPISAFWNKGKGVTAVLEANGLAIRQGGRRDFPPILSIGSVQAHFDLGTLLETPRRVEKVVIDGMQINIPPKGERPEAESRGSPDDMDDMKVVLSTIEIRNATLTILPKPNANPNRRPLVFEIAKLNLQDAGPGQAMPYVATLSIPKPPGDIVIEGTFGPWDAEEPGWSPLAGSYTFQNADLGIFKGIDGILESKGSFQGELSSVEAEGTTTVPDFRLKRSGNRVPLHTAFKAEIDGTNGNTTLKAIDVTLGKTRFKTHGAVIKHVEGSPRAIDFVADVPSGELQDMMRLAMKGEPMMEGTLKLHTSVHLPPLSGSVREKLVLDGNFTIEDGLFLNPAIQNKVDELSRRAQGQPKNLEIDDAFSSMTGSFHMEDEEIRFHTLGFQVRGAEIQLTGSYDLDQDLLDFIGTAALDSKLSGTLTGWKRWLARPLDPILARRGVGLFSSITVRGSAKKPDFSAGLKTKEAEEALARGALEQNR
jgi:hypothetical protein